MLISSHHDIALASKVLFQHSVGRVRAAVHECISRADIDPRYIPGLNEVYSKLKDPFKHLHSTYLQEKCFIESFGCIVSLFVVRNHPIFSADKTTLQIIAYFDEV